MLRLSRKNLFALPVLSAMLLGVLAPPLAAVAVGGGSISGHLATGFAGRITLFDAATDLELRHVDTNVGNAPDYVFSNLAPGGYKLRFEIFVDTIAHAVPTVPEFWNDKPTLAESDVITIVGSEAITHIDAQLANQEPSIVGSLSSVDPTSGIPVVFGLPWADAEIRIYTTAGVRVTPTAFRFEGNSDYRVWGIPAGTYFLSVRWSNSQVGGPATTFAGDVPLMSQSTPIVVTEGAITTVPLITMPWASSIAGNFTLPVSGLFPDYHVELTMLNSSSGAFEAVPDATGLYFAGLNYLMVGLWPGTYHVRIFGTPGQGWAPVWWGNPPSPYESGADAVVLAANYNLQIAPVQLGGLFSGRLGGETRYGANVAMSKLTFPGIDAQNHPIDYHIPVLYVASGEKFPDALSAGPAAIHQGGGLLLVSRSAIDPLVTAEIHRLKPLKIVVVGGTASVDQSVYDQLAVLTPSIERIGGASRYEVSRNIIYDAFGCDPSALPCPEQLGTVFVTTGNKFPDALAAGPAAGHIGAMVLLVDGSADVLDAPTVELLQDLSVNKAYIAGGLASVTQGIEDDLNALLSGPIKRLGGSDRFAASANINNEFFTAASTVFIASGMGFADALAGGPLAGYFDAPLYLSPKECLPNSVVTDLLSVNPAVIELLGGPASISDAVLTTSCG